MRRLNQDLKTYVRQSANPAPLLFNGFKRGKAVWKPDWRFSDGLTFQISAQSQKPPSIPL